MFTGIVQAVGQVNRIENAGDSARFVIGAGPLQLDDVKLGDSIAVSGPCLTVIEKIDQAFAVDVSGETLARTTLGDKRVGDPVNLEKALRVSDHLGGHLVTGHVDGVGVVASRGNLSEYVSFRVRAPTELAKYIASKGSISVDGVSLTVNAVEAETFDLMIIPHTLQETTLGKLNQGDKVNLEIDIVARYIERLSDFATGGNGGGVTRDSLSKAGFAGN